MKENLKIKEKQNVKYIFFILNKELGTDVLTTIIFKLSNYELFIIIVLILREKLFEYFFLN
jgi:hypothetical protein